MCGDGICRGQVSTWRLTHGLQVRLAAVSVCLVIAGAGIIGAGSVLLARGTLMRRAGQDLRADAALLTSRPFTLAPGAGFALPATPGGGFSVEVLGSAGQFVMKVGPGIRAPRAITGSAATRARRLAVAPADSGGQRWLMVAEPVRYRAQRILFTYGDGGFSLLVTGPHRPGRAGTLLVGLDLSSINRFAGRLAWTCLAVSGIVTVAAGALSAAAARTVLRPLAMMEQTVEAVRAGEFSRRVPQRQARDEAGRLARCLNTALSEVEHRRSGSTQPEAETGRSSERLSGTVTSTGRKLQRPIRVIHGFAEYYRQRDWLSPAEVDRMMRRVAAEAAQLEDLLNDLMPTPHDQPPFTAAVTTEPESQSDQTGGDSAG